MFVVVVFFSFQQEKHFYIGGNSLGDIRLNTTLNFEKQSSYMLTVSVSNSNVSPLSHYQFSMLNSVTLFYTY